ncbi:MAG: hypothetical protein K1X79_02570 [Oligoflexia bacterium]|nr:hypothetical protein [Oligoflexia bacterium]
MESVNGNDAAATISSLGYSRFLPEPTSRLSSVFSSILQGITGAAKSASGLFSGIDSGYVELLNKQIESQQQMQLVSMESNVEKSKHETQMAAIRNVRVG